MKIRAIITGASGMVGEGVLHECLHHPDVEKVLVIGRKPCGTTHPKLTEVIHKDFFNLTPIKDQLNGYNACYFCMGVSSVGMKEPEYSRLTFDLTLHMATLLSEMNKDMTFCYVSGAATDSSEKGKSMWARVKGKTENALLALPFRQAFMFRPGYMHPTPGLQNTLKYYKYITWMYPLLKAIYPKGVSTLADLGQAMLAVTLNGYEKKVLEVVDIKAVAKG